MKAGRALAKEKHDAAQRLAVRWWASFDIAIHRTRYWVVMYAAAKCWLQREEQKPMPNLVRLEMLRRRVDWAHDMMLSEIENVDTCDRQARANTMAARIHYEEYEQREWERRDD